MQRTSLVTMLLGLVLAAAPLRSEVVPIQSGDVGIRGELLRPNGPGPFPAVVALHGCSGLYNGKTGKLTARHRDWADRLVAAGYVVLFPDSFNSRGYPQICTMKARPITAKDRAADALAALKWLAGRADIDQNRISLLGWSHGAMTALWTVRPDFLPRAPTFKRAFAFYPGCREVAREAGWRPSVPLTLLAGAADDWTEPGPCRALAASTGFRFIEYPGAYHDFDAPDTPLHVRKGIGSLKSGEAHIGTDPAARAAAIKEVMDALGQP